MNEVLGSRTAIRILNVLFDNPSSEFKEISLIKSANTGKGSASAFVNRLAKEKFVICKRVGKTKMIRLNLLNESALLLKFSFGNKKLERLPKEVLASIRLLREKVKDEIRLMIVFGSYIAGTATENSDIDILIVAKDSKKINESKKEVEEMFGKKINLHIFDEHEAFKQNDFFRNALVRGIIVYGYDLAVYLLKDSRKEPLEKIEYLLKRHKSALRNYINKDYDSASAIIENILEQLVFLLLSRENIEYISKKDAADSLKKLPEGKTIENIKKMGIKQKIEGLGSLLVSVYANGILGEIND